jgi:hypothetical protein
MSHVTTYLFQLRKAAYAFKNSSTIILPEWFRILNRMAIESKAAGEKGLSSRMMPRDVATRWNYTYEFPLLTHIELPTAPSLTTTT